MAKGVAKGVGGYIKKTFHIFVKNVKFKCVEM